MVLQTRQPLAGPEAYCVRVALMLGMSALGIRAHMLRILFETILPVLCTGQKHPPNGASFGSVPSYVDIVITQNALTSAPCRACRIGGRSKGATEFVVAVSFIRGRGAGGCVRKPILARLGNPKENPVRHKRRSNSRMQCRFAVGRLAQRNTINVHNLVDPPRLSKNPFPRESRGSSAKPLITSFSKLTYVRRSRIQKN